MPRKKTNNPTVAQRERWGKIASFGCIICGDSQVEVEHCNTKMGLRKDHNATISLCFDHHRGENGIHTIGRKVWERRYGTEAELLAKTERLLNNASAPPTT